MDRFARDRFHFVSAACVALAVLFSASLLRADDCRRVDNIVILFDGSGFMKGRGRWEAFLQNMEFLESAIPITADGFFNFGLRHYGLKIGLGCNNTESVVAIRAWDPQVFLNAFPRTVTYGVSSLSVGLRGAADDASAAKGKTAILLIGGGEESCQADPIKISQQICLNYPDLEIHTFSMAGTGQEGEFFLQSIAANCRGTYNMLKDMGSPAGWHAWMKKVLVMPCKKSAAAPSGAQTAPEVPPILFDHNSFTVRSKDAKIDASNLAASDVVGRFMQQSPQSRVVLHGYSDGKGSQEHNLKLSRRRADAVAKHLSATYKVPKERIAIIAHGAMDATSQQPGGAASGLGRRVEFELFR